MGLCKPVVFGFIIASIGCYYGMSAKGGTQGVGQATKQADGGRFGAAHGQRLLHHAAAHGIFPILDYVEPRTPCRAAEVAHLASGRRRHHASKMSRLPSNIQCWRESRSSFPGAKPRS